ncbi:hypothetical protein ASPCAL02421 [Aspergillus calidoustus]|uniref:6-methylsalicylate decarboxylase n=1 Tax=Aspergillus calidoustus TaxID=454130 RepID=A0A0U5HF98_ASPCI|nr:hypothetical protein ASPCAL02421 [Aspergillus calidoustus]
MTNSRSKVDVHAHFVPPCWRDALVAHGLERPDGMPAIPDWDLERHIQLMDVMGIQKSYLSITSPGVHLVAGNDELARKLARDCNNFAHEIKKSMPQRIGSFVSLPLPDLQGSIQELYYACDTLQADGVVLQTNYHGRYLGDAYFQPIFEELDRRKVVVFIHPTSPCSHRGSTCDKAAAVPLPQYPAPVFEFMFDTCRCIIHLLLSGTIARYPNIRYVVPHAGGALPPLIQRFSEAAALIPGLSLDPTVTPAGVRATLNERFWFDTAGPTFPDQIRSLLQYVRPDRICYGTDYPFTPAQGVEHLGRIMEESLADLMDDPTDWEGVYSRNAMWLLEKPGSEEAEFGEDKDSC